MIDHELKEKFLQDVEDLMGPLDSIAFQKIALGWDEAFTAGINHGLKTAIHPNFRAIGIELPKDGSMVKGVSE